ncbi:SDR family NAD(P)-dependent oxidoreductase [Algicella marina]|uniref:SDR family NAD(P)-dependent oxidoreductase n=1 Tax=Algicella marina TaxID=2683284 RepID=A0A6P1T511_9RHOB|nr:SDR family NAD(P)-dependent oxidoreductase [Algicella marina]QHQ36783.1 SDR family NAD(P)-dependent oxidoreductase [Algicella marina]
MHILITGANRGIGKALAEASLARGWRVTGTVRTPAQVADVAATGANVIVCDMDRPGDIAAAFAGLPPLDILINNAGVIGPERQSPTDMDYGGFADTLRVNTIAPLAVSLACLPAMAKGGKILAVSSQMAYMGYRKSDRIAYRASKSALNKVMQGLATELEPHAVAVALLDPGWVRTDMGGDDADEDVAVVADGILQVAEKLTLKDTGLFFRFSGQQRPF